MVVGSTNFIGSVVRALAVGQVGEGQAPTEGEKKTDGDKVGGTAPGDKKPAIVQTPGQKLTEIASSLKGEDAEALKALGMKWESSTANRTELYKLISKLESTGADKGTISKLKNLTTATEFYYFGIEEIKPIYDALAEAKNEQAPTVGAQAQTLIQLGPQNIFNQKHILPLIIHNLKDLGGNDTIPAAQRTSLLEAAKELEAKFDVKFPGASKKVVENPKPQEGLTKSGTGLANIAKLHPKLRATLGPIADKIRILNSQWEGSAENVKDLKGILSELNGIQLPGDAADNDFLAFSAVVPVVKQNILTTLDKAQGGEDKRTEIEKTKFKNFYHHTLQLLDQLDKQKAKGNKPRFESFIRVYNRGLANKAMFQGGTEFLDALGMTRENAGAVFENWSKENRSSVYKALTEYVTSRGKTLPEKPVFAKPE